MPIEGFRRQHRVLDCRHIGMLLQVVVHSGQHSFQGVGIRVYGLSPFIRWLDRIASEGGQQNRFGGEAVLVVAKVFKQSDHSLQFTPGDAILLVEPVAISVAISLFEFVFNPVADVVLAIDGDAGNCVKVKVAGVVDGHASVFELELVGIGLVAGQRPVDLVDVVFGFPFWVRIHHDLNVGIVLVVVVHRLD